MTAKVRFSTLDSSEIHQKLLSVVRIGPFLIAQESFLFGGAMNSRTLRKIVFLLAVVCFTISGQAAFCDPLVKGPYLMLAAKPAISPKVVDNTAMTIRWEGDGNALSGLSCNLEWGGTEAYGNSAAVAEERPKWFSFTIRGLVPGALTFYRLTCKTEQYTGAFRAPPADAAPAFTFFAYGDTRGDGKETSRQRLVLGAMKANIESDAAKPYTLCLHTGDFVQRGQVREEWDKDVSKHSEFFIRKNPNMWFLSHLPVAGVLGNHEGYISGGMTDYADFGQNFKNYWPYPFYPDNRDAFYYSFDYGQAHFAVIDANDRVGLNSESGLNVTVAGLKTGTAQYDWLAGDLGSTKPWRIVAIHNPLYAATDGRDRFKKPSPLVTNPLVTNLHNLFKAKGVKLVLQGHNHYYSRNVVEGITYLTLGGGGAPLTHPGAAGQEIWHFGRFDIAGKTLTYTIINNSGTTIDSGTVTIP